MNMVNMTKPYQGKGAVIHHDLGSLRVAVVDIYLLALINFFTSICPHRLQSR